MGEIVVVSAAGELSYVFLSPDDGNDRVFRNVCKVLPLLVLDCLRWAR